MDRGVLTVALGGEPLDGALSVEHEDPLISGREGLEKAVDLLQRAVFETRPGDVLGVRS